MIILKELSMLENMGVNIHLKTRVESIETGDKPASFKILGQDFDAVYVGVGASARDKLGLEVNQVGSIIVDPQTFVTHREGVFAGGGVVANKEVWIEDPDFHLDHSPILAVSDGRRSATSIDRYFQRVSLTAARFNEGAYTTRLFTSLEGIDSLSMVKSSDPISGYNQEEALQEAQRCIKCQCLECVKVCEYLKQYGSYPKRYVREIYNNLSIVSGTRQKNQFINSCSLCGLCGEVCPEDLNMADVCLGARQVMVNQNRMPPSAHDFALRDMAFSNSEAFFLVRDQPGMDQSHYLFFPGCQLSASNPDGVEKTYAYLVSQGDRELKGGIGLMLRCCGAPAEWAGRTDLFQAAQDEFLTEYQRMGEPELILACSSCYQVFKTHYPQVKISSLWTVMNRLGLPPTAVRQNHIQPVAVHDPCSTRYETDIQDSARSILTQLGYGIEELPLSREKTECCSYGGQMWLANRKLAQNVIQRRIGESPLDYMTYCTMCRDLFAAKGKPTLHLLDLIFQPSEMASLAIQKGPDYSGRHENRARLKKKIT